MFQTKSTSGENTSLEFQGDQLLFNGKPFNWSLNRKNNNTYLIIKDHKSYRAEVLSIDRVAKSISIKVNKSVFDIELKDKMDLLLAEMGIDNLNTAVVNDLKAPMPGLIFDILVTPGQEVKKGDQLLILEAMKMENVLKAQGDGTVQSVEVAKGKSVEKGQVLIKF
ncbi:acetyl-CoA carboxylase biotin carboxyl carrier protein subunit [Roseivirga misakiensis]|uniref:Acetyl-CoA carboxylase biotin carboxyl carrier protein subunit n=1 Tax=Roseivirga misakiensis TaxID=1563681 RepID=A0A1E5SKB2_9BACT|nr:acetyl-CoA carboxylase biotin carboxyl carrier protein subunit [Roseivirga misakiensis]OEJ99560.1 acetyl-CoA carboxylase biotin carboxyl carrier protein subunit [Roseivirga misakiensis]